MPSVIPVGVKNRRRSPARKAVQPKASNENLSSKNDLIVIQELPVICDRGTKKNAKGYKTSWNGYKLHLDTNDTGLPISALVTSASLHDSQVAIPLIKLSSRKVTTSTT